MWLSRLFNVFRGDRVSRDIARELEFHLAEREDELVAEGMPRGQARQEARRRFGNLGAQVERARDADILTWLDSMAGDVRYALRSLAWSRGFTVVAVASLALGIGANTAIFSLINAVMLRALPVSRPEELVLVKYSDGDNGIFTNPLWEQVRDGQHVFDGVLAYGDERFNLAESGEERRVDGMWVSGAFFSMLGVQAAMGRALLAGDDVPGCPAVAVVSHAFWQSTLGSDPAAIGRPLRLNGQPFTIVGVVDRRFTGLQTGRGSHVYAPLCSAAVTMGKDNFLANRSWWFLTVLGRPRADLSLAGVKAQLKQESGAFFANTVPANWPTENQREYVQRRLDVRPSLETLSDLRHSYAQALFVLMAIVGMVLLIACANVANLMLARSAARQRELAVRVALGAGRARLVRQLFTEGLLLSSAGALLGVAFAWWGSRLLVGYLSTTRDRVELDLTLDLRVLGFTLLVAVLTALLFGLVPAWRAVRIDPQAAMKAQGRGVVEGHARFGIGKALVTLQVAMSLVLVAGAGLLLGSFRSLSRQDPGFSSQGVLVALVDLKLPEGQAAQGLVVQAQLIERLQALPGVTGAASSFNTPLAGMVWNDQMQVPGMTFKRPEDAEIWFNRVWEGYLGTLGMALVSGRDFTDRDVPGSPQVAIINETAAQRFFPGASPLGRTFRLPVGDSSTPPVEVVGVVRDAKYQRMREQPVATAFLAMRQDTTWGNRVSFEVRAAGAPQALVPAVSRVFADIAPRSTQRFMTLEQQVSESLRRDRILATLSAFFGGLALLLAMIGLYGTMSYNVARRRNEIGIRIALGAAQSRVLGSVLGEVGRLVGAGVMLGTVGAAASLHLVEGFLFGRTARDPLTLIGSALLLAGVAGLAGYLPARRASRMDPMATLREE